MSLAFLGMVGYGYFASRAPAQATAALQQRPAEDAANVGALAVEGSDLKLPLLAFDERAGSGLAARMSSGRLVDEEEGLPGRLVGSATGKGLMHAEAESESVHKHKHAH